MPRFGTTANGDDGDDNLPATTGGVESAIAKVNARKAAPPAPSEARCKVCQSPYRPFIDRCLMSGLSHASIAERVPGADGKKLSPSSIGRHSKKHMGIMEDAMRKVLEEEAAAIGQNWEEGVKGAVTHRGIIEVAIRKGYDDIISGNVEIEGKDLLAFIQAVQKMDEQTHAVQVDYIRAQMNAVMQAIQEVVEDPDIHAEIVDTAKRIMRSQNYELETVTDAEVVEELPPPR